MLIMRTAEGISCSPCALGSKQLAVLTRTRLRGRGLWTPKSYYNFAKSPGAELLTSTAYDEAPPWRPTLPVTFKPAETSANGRPESWLVARWGRPRLPTSAVGLCRSRQGLLWVSLSSRFAFVAQLRCLVEAEAALPAWPLRLGETTAGFGVLLVPWRRERLRVGLGAAGCRRAGASEGQGGVGPPPVAAS